MALNLLSGQDLLLLQHPLPAQEQQMLLDRLSWPQAGKGPHSWVHKKPAQNPKGSVTPH